MPYTLTCRFRPILLVLALTPAAAAAQDRLPPTHAITRPVLSIGTEGQPDYEFTSISAAFRTASGDIAITDASVRGIRVYDSQGRLLRRLGGEGEGPGEFRRINGLFKHGDSLTAYDAALRRLTTYSVRGTLLGTMLFRPENDEGLSLIGRFANGQWLVTTGALPPRGPGVYRDTIRAGVLSASATGHVQWLGSFAGTTYFVFAQSDRAGPWRVGILPYSPRSFLTTWRDSVLVGDLGAVSVAYYTPNGQIARVLPLPRLPQVTDPTLAQSEALALARTSSDSAYVRQAYEAAKTARARQIWERVVIAEDGALWLAVADPIPSAPRRYYVVAPNGQVRGSWLLPPRSRLLSVVESELLIAVRDVNDVEQLIVVRL